MNLKKDAFDLVDEYDVQLPRESYRQIKKEIDVLELAEELVDM